MNINPIRISSIVGMASAVLWSFALFIEYRYGLQPPGNSSLIYFADQIMFYYRPNRLFDHVIGIMEVKSRRGWDF